jgi:hypothetical protein
MTHVKAFGTSATRYMQLLFFALLLPTAPLAARATTPTARPGPACGFVQNRGQITDEFGNRRADIDFKVRLSGCTVFVGAGRLEYRFMKKRPECTLPPLRRRLGEVRNALPEPPVYDCSGIDMVLAGADRCATPVAQQRLAYRENYHTAVVDAEGANAAQAFGRVVYPNIYPGIDWVLYIRDGRLEYDFDVHPGGSAEAIAVQYYGGTPTVTDTCIRVSTPLGGLTEGALAAWLPDGTRLPCRCEDHDSRCGIVVAAAGRRAYTIDPLVREWGTYFGDGDWNCSADIFCCDSKGNVNLSGWTDNPSNIATPGAYQTVYYGQYDAFLAQFGPNGTLLWSTYFGGSEFDAAGGVVCDKSNSLYLAGVTESNDHIGTPGTHCPSVGTGLTGEFNFLAKFSDSGSIVWSTYYGGGHESSVPFVALDHTGNIYISGQTQSDTGIATAGAFQTWQTGYSACLAKFNPDGQLLWGTFFGGLDSNVTVGTACATDSQNNVYITGEVYGNGIPTTPGCFKDSGTPYGHPECFLSKFDSAGALLWSTYFGGDSGDGGQAIAIDGQNNVLLTGSTASTNGIATPGAYQTVYGGGLYDVFLAKFTASGSLSWSTYFGGAGWDWGSSLAVSGGNIYCAGTTISESQIATPGSYQDSCGGVADAFLSCFNGSGELQWATYYGGAGNESDCGICFDNNGRLFIFGYTQSSNNIATPGSFQPDFVLDQDAFLVKLDTGVNGIRELPKPVVSISTFPNPTTGMLTISGIVPYQIQRVSITITDAVGMELLRKEAPAADGAFNTRFDLGDLAPGGYILSVDDGITVKSEKVTKY